MMLARMGSIGLILAGLAVGILLLSIVELSWRGILPAILTCAALGVVEVLVVRRYVRSDLAILIWRLDDDLFPFVSLGVGAALLVTR
ncbi:MAG TPA: hypothetical protein VLI72_11965 [Methylibium sp.]|nr:hypothetical protein [Methylibium sp.]